MENRYGEIKSSIARRADNFVEIPTSRDRKKSADNCPHNGPWTRRKNSVKSVKKSRVDFYAFSRVISRPRERQRRIEAWKKKKINSTTQLVMRSFFCIGGQRKFFYLSRIDGCVKWKMMKIKCFSKCDGNIIPCLKMFLLFGTHGRLVSRCVKSHSLGYHGGTFSYPMEEYCG